MDKLKSKFSLIYDQFVNKIYRFVFIKVNSSDLAEDITSETFTRCWESLQKGTDIENVQAFLYRIARNLVTDYYRQKGKTGPALCVDDVPIEDVKADLVSQSFDISDMDIIKKGITNLNEDYQDILIWHYIEDMPVAEIALNLSKSEGAVRVMLSRAMGNLKAEVEKYISEHGESRGREVKEA